MKKFFRNAILVLSLASFAVFGQEAEVSVSSAFKAATPEKIRVIIADVGTINSVANTEKWLSEQLQPKQNIETMPALDSGASVDPRLVKEHFRWNMRTKQMEYVRASKEIQAENAENIRILRNLRTSTLMNKDYRNVILCKDFIQAALNRKYRKFFQVIDRGNIDMGMVEQELQGKTEAIGTANCIVTVIMGDLETSSSTVTINGKGTKVKTTVYKQPYTGKIRDLSGNVLLAFDGLAEHRINQNNVVKSEFANPSRELMQKACAKIADEIGLYFTKEIKFAVKGPKGDDKFDADDVTVKIDGAEVNIDAPIYAIACEHEIQATVSGYKKIQRVISLSEGGEGARVVKLNFKKLDAKAAED